MNVQINGYVLKAGAAALVLGLLAACASGPKPADWQLEAKGATDRAVAAYMEGNTRVEAVEFTRARADISATGRIDLMARAELLRCATRVASLVLEPCAAFDAMRADAPPAERAYADYLAGALKPQDAALLPEAQRAAATATSDTGAATAVQAITDPLSQLVAAGVALQSGRANPALVRQAVDTASAQGWRRPLLAWLGVQASLADKAGDAVEAARVRRRILLVENAPLPRPSASPAAVIAPALVLPATR